MNLIVLGKIVEFKQSFSFYFTFKQTEANLAVSIYSMLVIFLSRVLRDSTPRSVGLSVGRLVGWSVGWSVGQLVGWSVGWLVG